jgi:branched-chain amino acid transport system ATP-binding protein
MSAVFPHLTVLENVRVALQRTPRRRRSISGARSEPVEPRRARHAKLLAEVAWRWADTLAAELPYGRKRALEIATTLAHGPGADAAR